MEEAVAQVSEKLLAKAHQYLKRNTSGSDNSNGSNSNEEEGCLAGGSAVGEDDEDMT